MIKNKEKKWRFVSNLNAIDEGLNDAGIETFSADSVKSTIREVNQNSIDQISELAQDKNKPVTVEFEDFYISPNDFPNSEQFKDILDKCINSSADDKMVNEFFLQARGLMDKKIRVLRISDFNTTGLVGSETGKKGTPWYSLIKSKGSSNKNMNSGGSFGIGKSAPFACSNLRTIFYASKVDDIFSYIGVSRLISFQDGDNLTVGTGYYAEDERLCAILQPFGLNGFKRTENGTDIYIMGFDGEDDLEQTIKESVLSNFFISIYNGLLTVKYKDLEINKENLGQYIATLNDNEFYDIKVYYDLLCSNPSEDNSDIKKIVLDSKEYGEKFGIKDGECTLLLMRGNDLNKRVLMTRKPGMSLFLQSRINGSISFTGILLITGDNMNEIFKAMEMPAHDAWEPKRCKVNSKKYIDAYSDLKRYIKNKVTQCFGQTQEDTISAYGMEEFFSDIEDEQGDAEFSILEGKTNVTIRRNKDNLRRKNNVKNVTSKSNVPPDDVPPDDVPPDDIPPDDVPPDDIPPDDVPPDDIPPDDIPPDDVPPDNVPPDDYPEEVEIKYKCIDLKKRLICRNEKNGEYTLKFKVERKRKNIKLVFLGMTEQKGKNYKLNLLEVSVDGTNIGSYYSKENVLFIKGIPGKNNISVDFKINFNRKCMMEIDYYETR